MCNGSGFVFWSADKTLTRFVSLKLKLKYCVQRIIHVKRTNIKAVRHPHLRLIYAAEIDKDEKAQPMRAVVFGEIFFKIRFQHLVQSDTMGWLR